MHSMVAILIIPVLFRCFAKKHFIWKCASLVIKSGKSDSQCEVSYDNLLELRNIISIHQRELRFFAEKNIEKYYWYKPWIYVVFF